MLAEDVEILLEEGPPYGAGWPAMRREIERVAAARGSGRDPWADEPGEPEMFESRAPPTSADRELAAAAAP